MDNILCLNPDLSCSLLEANCKTIDDIIKIDIKKLKNVNISLENANLIKLRAAKERLKNKIFTLDQIEKWDRISTGCPTIDKTLQGGVPSHGIIEIYGASGVGKTQFCLQMALQVQLPLELGGKQREAVYIGTEDVFPSRRLKQLVEIYNNRHNFNKCFKDHIYIEHLAEPKKMLECLSTNLPKLMSHKNIGIIIIDSIAGIFRSENENPNYIARSRYFHEITTKLITLQNKFNCAILITNQIVDNIITGTIDPCLGLAWSNNITSRFCLKRNIDKTRTIEVIFAPDLPPTSAEFMIDSGGLV
ncbi:DNA repair protein XRCC3-like [Rhynchophorus ferrugineus]|uniref:DNA repair protein XRCC3-like n=1 Tax=Rhynchophorus ferrugineus TaxID=354439 RepID=UPI003FCD7874